MLRQLLPIYLPIRDAPHLLGASQRGKWAVLWSVSLPMRFRRFETGDIIFRYENADHKPKLNLPNLPHHKHEESEENIVVSSAPTLYQFRKVSLHIVSVGTRQCRVPTVAQLLRNGISMRKVRKILLFLLHLHYTNSEKCRYISYQ